MKLSRMLSMKGRSSMNSEPRSHNPSAVVPDDSTEKGGSAHVEEGMGGGTGAGTGGEVARPTAWKAADLKVPVGAVSEIVVEEFVPMVDDDEDGGKAGATKTASV